MLQTNCSVCGASIQFPEEWLGKRVHCPQCGNSPLLFSDAGLLTHSSTTEVPPALAAARPTASPRAHLGVNFITALAPSAIVGLCWLLTGEAKLFLDLVLSASFALGFGGSLIGAVLASYRLGGQVSNGAKGGMLAALFMLLIVAPVVLTVNRNWGPAFVVFILVPGTAALALTNALGGALGVYLGRRLAGATPRPSSSPAPPNFVNEK